jgi:hypothetical protein
MLMHVFYLYLIINKKDKCRVNEPILLNGGTDLATIILSQI